MDLLFLCLWALAGPSADWLLSIYIRGRWIFLNESIDSNASLFRKESHRLAQE